MRKAYGQRREKSRGTKKQGLGGNFFFFFCPKTLKQKKLKREREREQTKSVHSATCQIRSFI